MTEDDVMALIYAAKPRRLLKKLAALPEAERTQIGTRAYQMFKGLETNMHGYAANNKENPDSLTALTVAVLGTTSRPQLRKLKHFPRPSGVDLSLTEILRTLQPSWLQDWVNEAAGKEIFDIHTYGPLWRDGLCEMPQNDTIVLGYYAHWYGTLRGLDDVQRDPAFLNRLIWRFFEVEGSGEFSLASHDKYSGDERKWMTHILRWAQDGTLDREKLIAASLGTIARDFAQFRGNWYTRLHVALKASVKEEAAHKDAYLRLLSSAIPTTVSFAIKVVARLDKAGEIGVDDLLEHIRPALMSRTKATPLAGLRILHAAARRAPERAEDIAMAASCALVHEAADVQSKALDLIEALGAPSSQLQEQLAQYTGLMVPSLEPKLGALTGAVSVRAAPEEPVDLQELKAIPIAPAATPDAALHALLAVLESQSDPFLIEHAFDAMMRHGAALLQDEDRLSPLKKRSLQLVKRHSDRDMRNAIVTLIAGFATQTDPQGFLPPTAAYREAMEFPPMQLLLERGAAIVALTQTGAALCMLSAPSDTSGGVLAADLKDRMTAWDDAGLAPIPADLALALSRLSPQARLRPDALPDTKAEHWRAFAYALGAASKPGKARQVWAAAWSSRLPQQDDPAIAKLFPHRFGGCGTIAVHDVTWHRHENHYQDKGKDKVYSWAYAKLNVPLPPLDNRQRIEWPLPAFCYYAFSENWIWQVNLGRFFDEIAWAGLLHPWRTDPFFGAGIVASALNDKLSNHPNCAFLEPFFRPGPDAGAMGAKMLALYVTSTDPSVRDLAVEAVGFAVDQKQLDAADFSAGMQGLISTRAVPLKRWQKTLAQVASLSGRHATFVREVLTALCVFDAEDAPKDFATLLELLYELHVACDQPLTDAGARSCLQNAKFPAKAKTLAKKLLAIS